jgi:hypothetical protein
MRLAFPATGTLAFRRSAWDFWPGPVLAVVRHSLRDRAGNLICRTGHRYPEEQVSRTSPGAAANRIRGHHNLAPPCRNASGGAPQETRLDDMYHDPPSRASPFFVLWSFFRVQARPETGDAPLCGRPPVRRRTSGRHPDPAKKFRAEWRQASRGRTIMPGCTRRRLRDDVPTRRLTPRAIAGGDSRRRAVADAPQVPLVQPVHSPRPQRREACRRLPAGRSRWRHHAVAPRA